MGCDAIWLTGASGSDSRRENVEREMMCKEKAKRKGRMVNTSCECGDYFDVPGQNNCPTSMWQMPGTTRGPVMHPADSEIGRTRENDESFSGCGLVGGKGCKGTSFPRSRRKLFPCEGAEAV